MKQSALDTGRAQAAQATVDQVKVEGIDTNVAVMKVTYVFIKVLLAETIAISNLKSERANYRL